MKVSIDFTDMHCLKSLYFALVRSIVESSAAVWAPYQTTWIDRIERLQKRFVRFALRRFPWTDRLNLPPYEHRCNLLGIATLKKRRRIQQAMVAAKVILGEIDCPALLSKFSFNAPGRIQRRSLDEMFVTPFHRSVFGYFEPVTRIIRTFNKMCQFLK